MRSLLRTIKNYTLVYNPKARPVGIFGLRRGGTTMVSDAIWAHKGVWLANEPFAVLPNHPNFHRKKELLPETEHSHFFNLQSAELAQVADYFKKAASAEHRFLGTCKHPAMGVYIHRVCLKILNAPWMLDWVSENTDIRPLIILRHPAAQALSVLRQNWDFPLKAYAKDIDFLSQHFSTEQIETLHKVLASDNLWKIAICDWIINSHPLRSKKHNDYRFYYEKIAFEPSVFLKDVIESLYGIQINPAMQQTFSKPSGSSKMSTDNTNKLIRDGNISALIGKWIDKLEKSDLKECQKLLDIFGVDAYTAYDPMPKNIGNLYSTAV